MSTGASIEGCSVTVSGDKISLGPGWVWVSGCCEYGFKIIGLGLVLGVGV